MLPGKTPDEELAAAGPLLLASIADTLPDGLAVIGHDWKLLYANERARHIGDSQPQDIGRTLWDIWPQLLGQPSAAGYRQAMQDRREHVLDAIYSAHLGAWFSVHLSPVPQGIAVSYRDVSRERALDLAGSEATARLAFAMAAANGLGTFDLDFASLHIKATAAVAQLCGVDPARAAAGIPLDEITRNLFAEDVPIVQTTLDQAARTGREVQSEYRVHQPDGGTAFLSMIGRAILDPQGTPLHFTGIVLDTTASRLREHALRDSEERYRTLIELSPNAVWAADPAGLVKYANRHFLEYIGLDVTLISGLEYIDCFYEEDRPRVIAAWTHSVTTGEPYDIEARLLRASDGAARWWRLRALPIHDDRDVIQQWLGSAVDVHDARTTTQKLTEQYAEIDRQRSELEAIYRNSPIAMSLYSLPDMRVVRINERAARNLNLPESAVMGKTAYELAPELKTALNMLERAGRGEPVVDQHIQGRLPGTGAQQRHFNVNYSPVFAEDGSIRGVASASLDITTQKNAEAALMQSEKLAALGRMSSSIAHEINNPLESVTNLLYIAQQADLPEDVRHYLSIADQELRRIGVIASQTLLFHKQAAYPTAISAERLFSTVLGIYEGRLRNSGITVRKRFRCEHHFTCFEGDVRQVLNNLVGNAIDAMSGGKSGGKSGGPSGGPSGAMPGGGCLHLRCCEATHPRTGTRGVRMTIADTGTGIPADVQSRLFEAFYTTKGFNGNGLGLWISKDIMERHQGTIRIRSREQQGSVFALFLPLEAPTPTPDP